MKKIGITLVALLVALGASAQDAALNDSQIAGVLVTANNIDIDGGKAAQRAASSQDVKAFAKEMVTDHTASNKSAMGLMKKLKMRPEESAASRKLKASGDESMKVLKGLKGAAFDKAYIDNEVTMHEAVLDTIDKSLLPSASNAEIKQMVSNTRPVIQAHLDHAKKLQSTLAK